MSEPEADEYVRSLFVSWYPTAVRLALRYCGSVETSEDCVQEAFRQLFLALVNGSKVENPKAWTFHVIRREISRNHRAEFRRAECLEPTEVMDLRPGPHETLAIQMENNELTALMTLLTEREQEVLLLRMQGFRYQEVADALDISLNTVKTLLARSLRKLHDNASPAPAGQAKPAAGRFLKWKRHADKTRN